MQAAIEAVEAAAAAETAEAAKAAAQASSGATDSATNDARVGAQRDASTLSDAAQGELVTTSQPAVSSRSARALARQTVSEATNESTSMAQPDLCGSPKGSEQPGAPPDGSTCNGGCVQTTDIDVEDVKPSSSITLNSGPMDIANTDVKHVLMDQPESIPPTASF